MKWVLVVISFAGYEPYTFNAGVFDDMYECFYAREYFIETEFELDYLNNPINSQAICVRVEEDMLTSP